MRDLVEAMEAYAEGAASTEDLGKAVRGVFSKKRTSSQS